MSRFAEEQLNRENRQVIAQRERLVAALEEIRAKLAIRAIRETQPALAEDIDTIARKAIEGARRVTVAS